MNNTGCPICKSQTSQKSFNTDEKRIDCLKCGVFTISYPASVNWRSSNPEDRQITNASSWIREHQGIVVDTDQIEFLLQIKTPTVADRATKILVHLEKNLFNISSQEDIHVHDASDYSNNDIKRNKILNQLKWLGISYSVNLDELKYLLHEFLDKESGFLAVSFQGNFWRVLITPKGHAFLENLRKANYFSDIGFCAMWFDKRLLPLWNDGIYKAIDGAGYKPERIDTHQHNNRIDDEIIAMIRRSKFVVADFVGNRAGVYFEAGYALGAGLPVIWTCNKDKLHRIHFDNRQYNFVTWEFGKLDEFKAALQNRIEATIGQGPLQTT